MKNSYIVALTASVAIFAGCAPWYENVHDAERVNFNQMTPAAQATVRQEIGNQPITAITRDYEYGDPSYRVEVQRPGINPSLWVAADGSIIKESRRLVGANMAMNEPAGAQVKTSQSKATVSQSTVPCSPCKTAQSPRQSNGSYY